jgi:hypothetical protein
MSVEMHAEIIRNVGTLIAGGKKDDLSIELKSIHGTLPRLFARLPDTVAWGMGALVKSGNADGLKGTLEVLGEYRGLLERVPYAVADGVKYALTHSAPEKTSSILAVLKDHSDLLREVPRALGNLVEDLLRDDAIGYLAKVVGALKDHPTFFNPMKEAMEEAGVFVQIVNSSFPRPGVKPISSYTLVVMRDDEVAIGAAWQGEHGIKHDIKTLWKGSQQDFGYDGRQPYFPVALALLKGISSNPCVPQPMAELAGRIHSKAAPHMTALCG